LWGSNQFPLNFIKADPVVSPVVKAGSAGAFIAICFATSSLPPLRKYSMMPRGAEAVHQTFVSM